MTVQPHVQAHEFRAGAPAHIQHTRFGPLAELAGTWVGSGFNLISKPAKQLNLPFVLQVNKTIETLTFDPIGGPIPDRGSVQDDINLFGMTYLQQVSDASNFELLHVERGMWIKVPPTTDPSQPQTVARLSTIPHGDSLLAQGTAIAVSDTPPQIPVADPTPIGVVPPDYFPPPLRLPNTDPVPLPPGFDLKNVNQALSDAIKGQTITHMVVLQVSTNPQNKGVLPGPFGGGILNIPFVAVNANAVSLDAIFWIETVAPPAGSPAGTPPTLQLQYTQTVILRFLDIDWPHISVATLVKQ